MTSVRLAPRSLSNELAIPFAAENPPPTSAHAHERRVLFSESLTTSPNSCTLWGSSWCLFAAKRFSNDGRIYLGLGTTGNVLWRSVNVLPNNYLPPSRKLNND